jgi:NTE family protein
MPIRPDEVMASSALPPAFPAIRIDNEFYWDGGIYSNTPIEVVFTDYPRRSSVVFSAQLWRSAGPEPTSIRQVLDRYKDIQYASRHKSHVSMQEQLHNLRHVIRELAKRLPKSVQASPECQDLAGWGCGTTMHIIQMTAPRLANENLLKEMDFSADGVAARWSAGLEQARHALAKKAWQVDIDPAIGVMLHEETVAAG